MITETGRVDKNGSPVLVGDVFEFDDLLIIISGTEEARVFQNIVEYGVELEPQYVEVEPIYLDDLQFEYAEKIGTVFEDEDYRELYDRPVDIHSFRDEYSGELDDYDTED